MRGVILDLRASDGRDAHHAVLLADSLLDGGVIGRLRTRQRVRELRANRDCLLDDLPLAVLVDEHTRGAAEWLAAALQDNERAVVVGQRTRGEGYSKTALAVSGRDAFVWLPTGLLERGDGRSLLKPAFPHPVLIRPTPGRTPRVEWGVAPDHFVPPIPSGSRESKDAVLEKAVRLLRSRFVWNAGKRVF